MKNAGEWMYDADRSRCAAAARRSPADRTRLLQVLNDMIPVVSYLTLLDIYMIACIIGLTIACAAHAIIGFLFKDCISAPHTCRDHTAELSE